MRPPHLSRRTFLGGALALALAGCGSPDDGAGSDATLGTGPLASTTPADVAAGSYSLIALFDAGGGEVAAGIPQRLTFAIGDGDGVLRSEVLGDAVFVVSTDGETVTPPQTVAPRSEGLPRPYYPLQLTSLDSGLHQVAVTVAGEQAEASFVVGSSIAPVVPGGPMLAVDTPTFSHHRGVEPICTRQPTCPFHDVSLADALVENRPVALVMASPGHCDSSLCPPVLDLLVAAAPRFPSVTFVHAEVYADADRVDSLADASPTEVVRTYELDFEPSLLLATADGNLAERLDHIFDATELDEALARLIAS